MVSKKKIGLTSLGRAGRVVSSLLTIPILLSMPLLVYQPTPAEAISCSFFALGPDGKNIGNAPLKIRVFSISSYTSNLDEVGTGEVTFWYRTDTEDLKKYYTAPMNGSKTIVIS